MTDGPRGAPETKTVREVRTHTSSRASKTWNVFSSPSCRMRRGGGRTRVIANAVEGRQTGVGAVEMIVVERGRGRCRQQEWPLDLRGESGAIMIMMMVVDDKEDARQPGMAKQHGERIPACKEARAERLK